MTTFQAQQTNESLKTLIELAIQCGRRLQSPQTGYVHCHYGSQEKDPQHTIPLLENALFVLALLRSHKIENINEAKELLNHLLVFQSSTDESSRGNFPVYLHEYPTCRDALLAIHLLAPFYWILKHFGHILGQSLKKKLDDSIQGLLVYGFRIHEERPLPYSIATRLAAASQAYGLLTSSLNWQEKGSNLLKSLLEANQTDSWHSTHHLADLLVALQMVYPSIANSPWHALWVYLSQTWHKLSCSYVGPSVNEYQSKEEPEPTLYDLFLGYFSGKMAQRTSVPRLYHLQAALIQPCEDRLEEISIPFHLQGHYRGNSWLLISEKQWACTFIEKKQRLNGAADKIYSPLRFVWGNVEKTHTLVCQGGNYKSASYKFESGHFQLFLDLEGDRSGEEIDKQREISFYRDASLNKPITVEDKATTTFELGQQVALPFIEDHRLFFTFELLEGEGQFLGHLAKGNRPSQLEAKGINQFNAYDWYLFLRTIRRQGHCRLKVTIRIDAF